jgi:hypothetical protein
MSTKPSKLSSKVLAAALALTALTDPVIAAAQTPANTSAVTAPPSGQSAPPPAGSEASGSIYNRSAQQYDRAYADQYSRWAAENCVDQRNNNTAAGAVIGGVLGAVLGSNVAGHGARTGGAIVGGALGATAGAAVGASVNPGATCPPGYVVRAGAPTFYYVGPVYGADVMYGPGWYQPWVWVDDHWVYRPYRYWYWGHPTYWRPEWRAGPWTYHYRHW